MKLEPRQFDTLLLVAEHQQADAILAALAKERIQAVVVAARGGWLVGKTSKTAAVAVCRTDFERAKKWLENVDHRPAGIDWSSVSLAAAAETPLVGRRVDLLPPTLPIWWLVELAGIALCFMQWVFIDGLTHRLIYASSGLALAGLFLALWPFATRRETARSFTVS